MWGLYTCVYGGGLCGHVGKYTCAHGEAREHYWVPSFVTLHWVPLRQALLLEPASPSAPLPSWCWCYGCVQPQLAVSMDGGDLNLGSQAFGADILSH